MSDVRVYIATTTGPVAVQRITEEDPDVNSVICLAGKAVSLPISGAYDAFVRNPTGVIQRHFGHPAYRIDVADKIDEGYSWQLGILTAHTLQRAGRLAGPDASPETIVFATGEVDRDLNLHPVDGVAEKISHLSDNLVELTNGAGSLVIAVPGGTEHTWHQNFGPEVAPDGVTIEVLGVTTANELLSHLDLPALMIEEVAPPEPEAARAPERRRGRVLALASILALAAMGATAGGVVYAPEIKSWVAEMTKTQEAPKEVAKVEPAPAPTPAPKPVAAPPPAPKPEPKPVAAVTQPKPEPPPSKPAPPKKPAVIPKPKPPVPETDRIEEARASVKRPAPSVRIGIEELRAPPGWSCRDVRDGRTQPLRLVAAKRAGGGYLPSPQRNLCTVEIKVTGERSETHLFGRYQRWTQTRPSDGPADKVIDLGPRQGDIRWTVDIPDRLGRGALFRILVFSSGKEFTPRPKLLKRLDRLAPRSDEMKKLMKRLKKRGITITQRRFRIVPERRTPAPSNLPRNFRPPPPPGNFPPPPRG